MDKLRMSEMKDIYRGRMAVVMGGGPSLPGDLEAVNQYVMAHSIVDPVLIAVNYHAWQFVEPDYMVFNDHPEIDRDPAMFEEVERHRTVHVSSKEKWSDVIFDVPVWEGNYSSNTATWFALWMGCEPVVLTGMDCYQGEVMYCHPWKDQAAFHQSLDQIKRPWIEEGTKRLPNFGRVMVASGPLVKVFRPFASQGTRRAQRI